MPQVAHPAAGCDNYFRMNRTVAYLERERLAREERQDARRRVEVACPRCMTRVDIRSDGNRPVAVDTRCNRCGAEFRVKICGAA